MSLATRNFFTSRHNIIFGFIMVLEKLAGLLLIGAGLFLVVYFPDTEDMEFPGFNMIAIFAGLFLLVIGIRLLLG